MRDASAWVDSDILAISEADAGMEAEPRLSPQEISLLSDSDDDALEVRNGETGSDRMPGAWPLPDAAGLGRWDCKGSPCATTRCLCVSR